MSVDEAGNLVLRAGNAGPADRSARAAGDPVGVPSVVADHPVGVGLSAGLWRVAGWIVTGVTFPLMAVAWVATMVLGIAMMGLIFVMTMGEQP